MSTEKLINDHLSALNLLPDERKRVNAAQHELNQRLSREFDPQGEVRVGGSFARGTAIRPLHDVDLLLVLSEKKVPNLLSQNPAELVGKLAADLQRVLGVAITAQNRSFKLHWQEVEFDLVPCAETTTPGELRLPDLGRNRWLVTSPKRHYEQLQRADQACKQRLLPIIRGVKAWRRNAHAPVSSFHLEAMLCSMFTAPPQSWAEGLQVAFTRLSERVQKGFSDPTGLGARVDERMTETDRARAAQLLRDAASTALALNSPQDADRALRSLLGARL